MAMEDISNNLHSEKKSSVKTKAASARSNQFPSPSVFVIMCTCFSYFVLMAFGCLRELLRKMGMEEFLSADENDRTGYTPLYKNLDSFMRRAIYSRVWDILNKPISSVPGAYVDVKERIADGTNWKLKCSGSTIRALNLTSYNYLGFAETDGVCAEAVKRSIRHYGAGAGSTRCELGTLDVHLELEKFMAWYAGTEDSMVVGMGFATNSACIPSIVGPGCLILSDQYNHSSLILGSKLSGAKVKTFRHNDVNHLEDLLIEALSRKREPHWKKILIIVEGIYSMEGTIINLPEVIRLKKRYKAYLYLDEAHSFGAIGPNGRGVIDYYGCDPADVDILMGTFSKSFGAVGGFVAGTQAMVSHQRRTNHSFCYGISLAAPIAQQVLEAGRIVSGLSGDGQGTSRIESLRRNTHYFRRKLQQMGVIIYGSDDSPVVPLLIYVPCKVAAFVRMMESRKVATVGVAYPIVSFLDNRARFCLSAAHDRQMLDDAIAAIDEVGDILSLKYLGASSNHEVIEY